MILLMVLYLHTKKIKKRSNGSEVMVENRFGAILGSNYRELPPNYPLIIMWFIGQFTRLFILQKQTVRLMTYKDQIIRLSILTLILGMFC